MNRVITLALASVLVLGTACNDDETENTDETDVVEARLVSITGGTSELLSGANAQGLCAIAVDPADALDGKELNVLGQTTVGADGTYTITDVDVDKAPLAIFVVIQDCNNEGTAFPTGTGIAAETYASAQAGDSFTRSAVWISSATATGINNSFAAANSTATLADGAVMGLVYDSDGSTPVAGATVDCQGDGCDALEVFYADTDSTDGIFSTAGVRNTETSATGLVAIPSGPVANYGANADGKTFSKSLFGSIEGLAAFTAWTAE